MDGSTSRPQVMIKLLLIKAGIPLALSVAGFVCAKMMARKDDKARFEKFKEDEKIVTSIQFMHSVRASEFLDKLHYEQEILSLRCQVEELQKREMEMKMQFVRYHDLKEQESLLLELRNVLLLEKSYVGLLGRDISSMESGLKRLENLVFHYVKVMEQLQHWKSENGLLSRKVKKLMRKTRKLSAIVRGQNLKIESTDAELLRNLYELEERSNGVQKLENEVKALHFVIDELEEQKAEIMNKLQQTDQSVPSVTKNEDEGTVKEDYLDFENSDPNHNVANESSHACSKRQKMLKNLKKWVIGGEKMKLKLGEKEKHEIKCFGRHSYSSEEEEEHTILARKSCSSA